MADMELALSESLRQLESQQKEMDEKALKYSMDTYDQVLFFNFFILFYNNNVINNRKAPINFYLIK